VQFVLADLAVLEFADHGGRAQRDLVHAVAPVDHQRMLGAQALQRAHLDAHQVGWNTPIRMFGAPAGLVSGPRMLKMVLMPNSLRTGATFFMRRMVVGREHEADADLSMQRAICSGFRLMLTPERLQHVGAARLARHAAPAVLADLGAGRGRDEHRAGRDVEGVRAVAAGADDVDQVRVSAPAPWSTPRASPARRAVISPMVSFLTRRPVISAAIITGEHSPLMMSRTMCSISSWKTSRCSMVRWSASCGVMGMVMSPLFSS
jgi:hypothetical protein